MSNPYQHTNHSLAQAWAEQIEEMGKTSHGSMSFHTVALFSYVTRVATHFKSFALVSDQGYSKTTQSKHLGPAMSALTRAGIPYARVHYVQPMGNADHKSNLEWLDKVYYAQLDVLAKVRGMREWPQYLADAAERAGTDIENYVQWFDVAWEVPHISFDISQRRAEHAQKVRAWNEPSAAERRLRAQARRDLKSLVDLG